MAMGWLVAFVRADSRDLGLPSTWLQLLRDVGLGALACLASLLPVFVIQFVLVVSSDSQTQHPLIEALSRPESDHHPWLRKQLALRVVIFVAGFLGTSAALLTLAP